MHLALKELPIVDDYGDGFCSRLVEWGGMIVSYETFPKGVDATPLFKGLPDDMCQAPHWGYILKGRVRIRTRSGDAVLRTGDAYYLEPGHVPVYEEDTEVLEFSPKTEYEKTIDIVNKNIAATQTTTWQSGPGSVCTGANACHSSGASRSFPTSASAWLRDRTAAG